MNFSSQYVPRLVSVIVPVYNRAHLVGKTLDSILNQTYRPVEVIAVNDGSTDASLAVLEAYAARHPGQVFVLNQANAGQVRARNNGLCEARGEFIAFLDSDDTWESEKLALQIPLFREGVGLVYCAVHEVDESGNVMRSVPCDAEIRGDAYTKLLIRNRMTGGSVVVTREALATVGLFDESLKAAENWDLWIRIAKDFEIACVDLPLVRYLKHQGNMSHDKTCMTDAAWSVLQKHLPDRGAVEGALRPHFDTAYAYYYYQRGVREFSVGRCAAARTSFLMSWRYRPFYRDSAARLLRSFLGSDLNRMLTSWKRALCSRSAG